MPAQRSPIARVFTSPWWWCVAVAALVNVGVTLLIIVHYSVARLPPMTFYHRRDTTIWGEGLEFGRSSILFSVPQQLRGRTPNLKTIDTDLKDPPAWFPWFDEHERLLDERGFTGFSVEAFGWPYPEVVRTRVQTFSGWVPRAEVFAQGPTVLRAFPPPNEILWRGALANFGMYTMLIGLPLLAIFVLRRRRRVARGHCPACDYDRKGLDAADPCPECGAGPPAPAANPHK